MGYLSAQGATGKTLLLIAFSALALGVSVILAYEMLQIRKAGDFSRDSF